MDRDKIDKYSEDRRRMVTDQIRGRGIFDPRVLAAFEEVPRHLFVPERDRYEAYEDYPLAIGNGQTISQPYIVAYMTEKLSVTPDASVLEVGTGSGYQAAILSRLAAQVYTVETVEVLYRRAKRVLGALGYGNVTCYLGDGYLGIPDARAFDRIIVTAAAPRVPETLVAMLKSGGRMVVPVGSVSGYQELVLVLRDGEDVEVLPLIGVRFVPMTGRIQRDN